VAALQAKLEQVHGRIAAACARVGRDPADVTVLPVSKSVDAGRLRAALAAGMTTFAENRVQEAEAKAAALPGARWQLVGHLQSNKAPRAVGLFEVIHSLDTLDLARRLDRLVREAARAPLAVYIQVNVDRDPSKTGMLPEDLAAALPELAGLDGLELRGLMTVGRLVGRAEEARPTFVALRELAERLRRREPRLGGGLSMGMSDDFEVAVEEGASVVRVGRAIFGDRPPA
jgi:pyridoxal phosphate enzyme (YggS family)